MKTVMFAIAMAALPLAGASATQDAPVAAAKVAKFTLDTPIEQIVADPKGKAALDAGAPGVTSHASYDMFKGMSLNQLKAYAADQLTPEVLANTEKALAGVE